MDTYGRFLRIGSLLTGLLFLAGCHTDIPFKFDGEGLFGQTDSPVAENPIDDVPIVEPPDEEPPEEEDPDPYVDEFVQNRVSEVDIVWVIDNSLSMSEEQEAIRREAPKFTARLQEANVDFRLMIITTDASEKTELQPSCGTDPGTDETKPGAVITPANAEDFGDCAVVGVMGSWYEEGIEAARRALDPNYPMGQWGSATSPAPLNPTFLRDGVPLELVFVSDEQDQPHWQDWGDEPADQALLDAEVNAGTEIQDDGRDRDYSEAYVPLLSRHKIFFNALKGPGSYRAHAIVLDRIEESGCRRLNFSEEIGRRYIDFARLTGGSVSDVCGDWSETMDQLGLQATGLQQCFALRHMPTDPTSISVQLDNVETTAWTYIPTGNSVCFDDIPAENAVIVVTYY